jgi:hypothetical protein
MRGMEFCNARAQQSFRLALLISLLLHAAVLFIGYSSSGSSSGPAAPPTLQATLATKPAPLVRPLVPPTSAPPSTLRKATRAPAKSPARRLLTAPTGVWANRSFSPAERADMDNFLNDLATQAKPPSGRELSKRALAMARQLGRAAPDDGEEEDAGKPGGKTVEPFSLEMYFDAFVRKLNRSAAFVKNEQRTRGLRKALVRIALNADGSLKSYRVLRSGDQAAEIAYIKSVIDRAAPFSAFPPDIRQTTDSLSILMCIYPAHDGEGGGFSRSFGGQDCRD